MLIFSRFIITLLGTLLFECPWIGIADNTIFNKTCNTSIPQIRERYGDVHTQDGNTLTYVCVGIFALPIYVAVALPYPRGRGVSRLPCMQMMVWTSSTRLSFVGKVILLRRINASRHWWAGPLNYVMFPKRCPTLLFPFNLKRMNALSLLPVLSQLVDSPDT